VEALEPPERVLVIGESSMPQSCIKSDEVALMTLFRQVVHLPAPDHSGRLVRQACMVVLFAALLVSLPACHLHACIRNTVVGYKQQMCWPRRFGEHTSPSRVSRCLTSSLGLCSGASRKDSCQETLCRWCRRLSAIQLLVRLL
jgi:hypothetical protein